MVFAAFPADFSYFGLTKKVFDALFEMHFLVFWKANPNLDMSTISRVLFLVFLFFSVLAHRKSDEPSMDP